MNKLYKFFIIFVVIFSFQVHIFAISNTDIVDNTKKEKVDKSSSDIINQVKDYTPAFVGNILDTLDSFRVRSIGTLQNLENKLKPNIGNDVKNIAISAGKNKINKIIPSQNTSSVASTSDSFSLEKTLAYLKYYGIVSLLFIVNTKLVFYGILVLLLFFTLRFILRIFRK